MVGRFAISKAVAIAISLLAAGCSGQNADGAQGDPAAPLRVGLIPNVAPDDQQLKYEAFGDYLEERLDRDVELFVATNYAGTVAALESGKLDLAYLGGLTYVQAEERIDLTPLVTEVDRETHTTAYLSQIVTAADSGIRSLGDLEGQDFAFGDPNSTSGSLYPRSMLIEAGFDCSTTTLESCPPLGRILFAGGHDAAALAVVNGQVAAAGLEARILHALQADGVIEDKIVVLAETEVMGYPWVVPASTSEADRDRLAEAFLSIQDPDLLDLLRAETYERVTASDYDEVRTLAAELGLLSAQT